MAERPPRSLAPADYPPQPFAEADWRAFAARCADLLPRLPVTARHRSVLEALFAHLAGVNAWFNLTRIAGPADYLRRHVLDSLLGLVEPALQGIGPGETCCDLGSGGGYPGLPLALWRPDTDWVLVDGRRRKVAFLREAAALVAADRPGSLTCRACRARDVPRVAPDLAGVCRLVASRAAGPAARLLAESRALLAPGGHLLLYKGPGYARERAAAERAAAAAGFHPMGEHTLALRPGDEHRRLIVFRLEG